MNAKKTLALLLSVLMVVTCLVGMMTVSAEEADKFAPANEEAILLHDGAQSGPLGSFGKGQTFGAMVTVEAGKRLTQINFHALATYNNNVNNIVFKVYQWDTDYATTVAGDVLAQTTIVNQVDNAALDVILPTNRNLTGELLFTATYVDGGSQMTPWSSDGNGLEGVQFFANGTTCQPYCVGITIGDALTVEPASYTATFVADGNEVAKITFLEGDKELINVPAVPEKEGFWGDWSAYTLGNGDITVEAVGYQVAGYGIAETVEEVGADTNQCEVYPRLVLQQIGKGTQRELIGTDGFQALFGEQTASQGHGCGYNTQSCTQHGILMCLGAAHHLLQIGERKQGDEAHSIGSHHAVGRELVLFVIVVGHYTQ